MHSRATVFRGSFPDVLKGADRVRTIVASLSLSTVVPVKDDWIIDQQRNSRIFGERAGGM